MFPSVVLEFNLLEIEGFEDEEQSNALQESIGEKLNVDATGQRVQNDVRESSVEYPFELPFAYPELQLAQSWR